MITSINVNALPPSHSSWKQPELSPLAFFYHQVGAPLNQRPPLTWIDKTALPSPFDFLLTRPLMTVGIQQFYKRAPKVRQPIYSHHDLQRNTYSRAIVMIIDQNKNRDDALTADRLGETTLVELGLIIINFNALPKTVINDLLKTRVPFGALLVKYHIKTHDLKKQFFTLPCDQTIAAYLQCPIGKTLYGRTNTLVRDDDHMWVARVVEILK